MKSLNLNLSRNLSCSHRHHLPCCFRRDCKALAADLAPGLTGHRVRGAGDRRNLGEGLAGGSTCRRPLSPGCWRIAQGHRSQACTCRCPPFPFGCFLFDVHFNQRRLLRGSGGSPPSLWLASSFYGRSIGLRDQLYGCNSGRPANRGRAWPSSARDPSPLPSRPHPHADLGKGLSWCTVSSN